MSVLNCVKKTVMEETIFELCTILDIFFRTSFNKIKEKSGKLVF